MTYEPITIEGIVHKAEMNNPGITNAEKTLIRRAFDFAAISHKGQKRLTGEDYVNHPLRVANTIASWRLDTYSICAALLHDVVEDTSVTLDNLKSQFPEEIVSLVDSLTAPDENMAIENGISPTKEELDKLYDIRLIKHMNKKVLLLKTADRIDNLYSIEVFPPIKKIAKCDNTRDYILPPLKRSMAFHLVDIVENALIRVEHPERYATLEQWYNASLVKYSAYNKNNVPSTVFTDKLNTLVNDMMKIKEMSSDNKIVNNITKYLAKAINSVEINKRTISSLYRQNNRLSNNLFKESLNLTISNCPLFDIVIKIGNDYSSKDIFHKLLDNYLIKWRASLVSVESTSYQDSSYYLVRDKDNILYRIFVRTDIEYWRNKIGDIVDNKNEFDLKAIDMIDPRHTYNNKISVYLRDGTKTWISEGATTLDLAFQIHTWLGLNYDYCYIDGSPVKRGPETRLKEGDQVCIISSREKDTPKLNWFKFATTPKAIQALIDHYSNTYNIPIT